MTKYFLTTFGLLFLLNINFGQHFWKQLIGPDGRLIDQIGVDKFGNYYLLVKSKHKVFRSKDNCLNWEPLDQGLESIFISFESKFVNGNDSSMYLKTDSEVCVLRPDDDKWIKINLSSNKLDDIGVSNNGDIYISSGFNLFRSTNNGASFRTISMATSKNSFITAGLNNRNYMIGMDESNKNILLVFEEEGKILKISDMPPDLSRIAGLIIDRETNRLFIYGSNKCYYSDNEGTTWNHTYIGSFSKINYIAISPNNTLYCNAGKKIYRSIDHGIVWEELNTNDGLLPEYIASMAFYSNNDILVLPDYYYDRSNMELCITNDGFSSCQEIHTGIKQLNIQELSKDKKGTSYAKVGSERFLISFDDWQSWKELKLPFDNEYISYFNHDENGTIYVISTAFKKYRSSDYGLNWKDISPANTGEYGEKIQINPDGKIYLNGLFKIYSSYDQGDTWEFYYSTYYPNFGPEWFFHPDGTIYATDLWNIYYSKDDGRTWSQLMSGSDLIAFHIAKNGDILVILEDYANDHQIGLYKYIDGELILLNSQVYGYSIESNTDGDIFIIDDDKILRSDREGKNWEDITYNFENTGELCLLFVDNDQYLYACADFELIHKSNFSIIQNHVVTVEVFLDANNNCVKDESEHGLEGWKVVLSGTIQRELITNYSGNYATKISDGQYRLKLVLPDEGVWFTCENEIVLNFDSPQKDTTVVVFTVQDKTTGSLIETGPALPIVEIHPNPFTERTRIMIKNVQLPENSILRVYDHIGQLIRIESVFSNEFEFHRNGLPAGLYFFEVSGDNSIIARGKLMIQ